MALMGSRTSDWCCRPVRSGRESAGSPVASHNRGIRDGPVKNPEHGRRHREGQNRHGQVGHRRPQQSKPVAPVTRQNDQTLVTAVDPDTYESSAQELATLREDLAAQEALRARERELKKAAEEEQRRTADSLRRTEESLRRGHQAYDRLKEEKDKLLQEKEKLRRMEEVEIEHLKEELRQQKDREDRARRLINQKLKQKTDDFDRLHRDYKHLDADHKKLTTESDRQ